MKKPVIKVGICVAYDWELLRTSIPRIYEAADTICLGLDAKRISWSGNKYEFDDQQFYDFIKEIDKDKKIIVYEDRFSLKELNARENCNRHRMMIADKLGEGGWHIQVDSDEYFLDFAAFTRSLLKLNAYPSGREKPYNVCAPFVPLIKRLSGGYLYVDFRDKLPEMIPVATTRPNYERARQNGYFNVYTRHTVIHETWARGEDELWYKLNNWGHSAEELEADKMRASYFRFWQSLDEYNYQYARDLHPAKAGVWPAIAYQEGRDINEFIRGFKARKFPLSNWHLFLKNNRNVARIKQRLGR